MYQDFFGKVLIKKQLKFHSTKLENAIKSRQVDVFKPFKFLIFNGANYTAVQV